MDYYVGFQVHWDPNTHTISIIQARYISDILQRFQLDKANLVSTPTKTHMPFQATLGSDDLTPSPFIPYRKAIGCLIYAMVRTRLDIAFAVNMITKFTSHPRNSH